MEGAVMRAWHVDQPGPVETGAPAGAAGNPGPDPAAERAAGPGSGVWGVPYRPASFAGRRTHTPTSRRRGARSRSGRHRRGEPARTLHQVPPRRPCRHRMAAQHLRGRCRWCRHGRENLCAMCRIHRMGRRRRHRRVHGGRRVGYAYGLPEQRRSDDEHAAPLLCAGIIGYRGLLRAEIPPAGQARDLRLRCLAHLATQVTLEQGATRPRPQPRNSSEAGAHDLGDADGGGGREAARETRRRDPFAPAGELVPRTMQDLDHGGTLAIAGIYVRRFPR